MPREENKEIEEERKAKNAYDLIRIRLNRLEKNIEKPAPIPTRRDDHKPKEPPEFVRNIVGSSAAAGSAEFHIFRNNKRREQERLEYIQKMAKKEDMDQEFEERKRERREAEEQRTAKKREKRQRQKERRKQLKLKKKKKTAAAGDDSDESSASSNSDGEEEEEVNKKNCEEKLDSNEHSAKNDEEGKNNKMPNFIISALLGPRLYWHYGNGHSYQPNLLESSGDKMFTLGNCIYNTACMLSFIIVPYVLTTWTPSGYGSAARTATIFYVLAFCLRTTGRLTNSDYKQFISELERAKADPANSELRTALKRYDFQVATAPPDFIAAPAHNKWFHRLEQGQIADLWEPLNSLRALVGWLAANTIGRRLIYPGSLAFLQSMVNSALIERRQKLIQEKGAQRNILQTEEGDKLDSLFIDNRSQGRNGDILVICCEGNAGFYETGVMKTPLELEYSVLGWNMPGFAESSGTPYPKSLLLSMEAVMQFATQKCGFRPEQIVLYAWSIGGFPGTWAATNYPQIRALILDASFDDLVPLAIAKMPQILSGIVRFTIQRHLNLPISKQLNLYKGPVVLIRRWHDEMIVTELTSEEDQRASNRANWLLLKLIDHRYPGLIASSEDEQCIFEWLDRDPQSRLIDFPPEHSEEPNLPLDTDFTALDGENRTRLIHQLCSKYFIDFMYATHNDALKPEYFNIPRQ